MAFQPTDEQKAIIEAPLEPQCVIACAGSGKTATAVRRLLVIRQRLGTGRGYVALLSFSNTAVDTFRQEYTALASTVPGLSSRVYIGTMDSFITSHILLPHAARHMGCNRQPFLVEGPEPFLKRFKVYNGDYPVEITQLHVTVDNAGEFRFALRGSKGSLTWIDTWSAKKAIADLSKTGAYTHDTGRYWALRTLRKEPHLAEILAKRYPYILVDEAQDIGSVHGAILELLRKAGSILSLIGDPNQAIYEFADADGGFLKDYSKIAGVLSQPLTQNRRSVESIVHVANAVSKTVTTPFRENPQRKHGAYYIRYDVQAKDRTLKLFASILEHYGYSPSEAIVLCRGSALVRELTGGAGEVGQGATRCFADAAIARDYQGNMVRAFQAVLDGTLRLLDRPPKTLRSDVLLGTADVPPRLLRRILWRFLRDRCTGLPAASLAAKTEWHPALKSRIADLLQTVQETCGFRPVDGWKHRLKSTGLPDSPLIDKGSPSEQGIRIRISTVHQAKGESIEAVLYVMKPSDVSSLLGGPVTEEGRIGYVAITRAKDLLLIAVPDTTHSTSIRQLANLGFTEWS